MQSLTHLGSLFKRSRGLLVSFTLLLALKIALINLLRYVAPLIRYFALEDRRASFIVTMCLYVAQTLSSVALSQMQEWCNSHIAIANTRATLHHIYLLPYSTQEELSYRNIAIIIDDGNDSLKMLFANVTTCISILTTVYLYSLVMVIDSPWNIPYIGTGIAISSFVLVWGIRRASKLQVSSNIYEQISGLIGRSFDYSVNHEGLILLARVKKLTERSQSIIRTCVILLLRLASAAVLLFVLSAYVMASRSIDFSSRTSYGYYLNQVLDIYLLLPQFVSLAYNSVMIEMKSSSLNFILALPKRSSQKSITLPKNWNIEIADLRHNSLIVPSFRFTDGERIGIISDNSGVFMEIIAGLLAPIRAKVYLNGKNLGDDFASLREFSTHVNTSAVLPRGTFRESFEMLNGEISDRLNEVLELVELSEYDRDCNVMHMSLGERNRLQLARNLLRIELYDYKIVLLDDIDSGLSVEQATRIIKRILLRYGDSSMSRAILLGSCRREILELATKCIKV